MKQKIFVISTSNDNTGFLLDTYGQNVEIVGSVKEADLVLILHRSALVLRLKTHGKPTIFISMEPDEDWFGAGQFLKQFNLAVTSDSKVQSDNHIIHPAYTSWLYTTMQFKKGRHVLEVKTDKPISACTKSDEVKKNICLVTSNKSWTAGHRKRLEIVNAILANEELKYIVDVYGQGFRAMNKKYDVLRNYDSVIVIENQEKRDYWTEKLADSVILQQNILYIGCQNIFDYFYDENITLIQCSENIQEYIDEIQRWSHIDPKYLYGNEKVLANRLRALKDYSIVGLLERISNKLNENEVRIIRPSYHYSDSVWKCLAKNIYYFVREKIFRA